MILIDVKEGFRGDVIENTYFFDKYYDTKNIKEALQLLAKAEFKSKHTFSVIAIYRNIELHTLGELLKDFNWIDLAEYKTLLIED